MTLFQKLLLPAALALTACGSPNRDLIENAPLISTTLKDDLGRELRYIDLPQSFVSLSPNITETLVCIGAEKKLVGVCERSPQYIDAGVARLPAFRVSPDSAIDVEGITQLSPGLVLADASFFSDPQAVRLRFELRKTPVFFQRAQRLADVYRNIRNLGLLTGRQKQADDFAARLEGFIKELADSSAQKDRMQALVLVQSAPPVVVGGDHYLTEILAAAGIDNLLAQTKKDFVQLSADEILKLEPKFLFMLTPNDQFLDDLVINNPKLNVMGGYLQLAFQLNPKKYLRPGPQFITALKEICSNVRPGLPFQEIFDKHFDGYSLPVLEEPEKVVVGGKVSLQ